MSAADARLVVFAPGVHTGGGLVLLRALLEVAERPPVVLVGDARATPALAALPGVTALPVVPTPWARFAAQTVLRGAVRPGDTVLCMQGVPPWLPVPARVVVFHQNRLVPGGVPLTGYRPHIRAQVLLDRFMGRALRHRVSAWYVQTPTMRRALLGWLGPEADVRVLPYVPQATAAPPSAPATAAAPRWDFVYVSDGVPHKNHLVLVDAWRELAAAGLRPSLAITLGARDARLAARIAEAAARDGLRIENAGHLDRDGVVALYRDARALLYPSLLESYGLPLVEAAALGVPIVASERDYVRDVCVPVETFDPASPVSVARAVRRFLEAAERPAAPRSAADFLAGVLG